MKRVTGIGGIFFKSADAENLKAWYSKHLGIVLDAYGTSFIWKAGPESPIAGSTAWNIFEQSSTYMNPSPHEFMINYRVENLENLLKVLESEGILPLGPMETYEYGKFAHILDPEGRKIELWEPNDEVYSDMVSAVTPSNG